MGSALFPRTELHGRTALGIGLHFHSSSFIAARISPSCVSDVLQTPSQLERLYSDYAFQFPIPQYNHSLQSFLFYRAAISPSFKLANMSGARLRLQNLASQFLPIPAPTTADPSSSKTEPSHRLNFHTLSPTYFLPRAASIEPDVGYLMLHQSSVFQVC